MNSQIGSTESNTSSPAENIRTICTSAAVAFGCFAFYFAEERGFRLFEASVRNIQAAEMPVPSPLEILIVLGVTSIGVCAAAVALISLGIWFVQQMRHANDAAEKYAENASNIRAHHSVS